MPMVRSNDLNEFITALRDEAYFERAGPGLALLEPGDWQGVVQWGEACGFTYGLKDLHAYCKGHPQVFEAIEEASRLSPWNLETLEALMS